MSPGAYIEEQVIDYAASRLRSLDERLGNHSSAMLFAYSVSEDASVESFPRDLACAVDKGVWSKIETDEEIWDSLTSYYQLFALGLGGGKNQDWSAWVEPYQYSSSGVLGTTVSAPVYDRDKQPPLFLGVVGFDFRLSAIDVALEGGSQKTLERVIKHSTAKCPSLELDLCTMESFRRSGSAGDDALCTNECSNEDFADIEPEKCTTQHDYPRELWANTNAEGLSYEEKACCIVGENKPSDQCPAKTEKVPWWGWMLVGLAALFIVFGNILYYMYREKKFRENQSRISVINNQQNWPAQPSRLEEEIVLPPAINPVFAPTAPEAPLDEVSKQTVTIPKLYDESELGV